MLRKIHLYYLITAISGFLVNPLSAQPDNKISCVALVKKDSVILRWVPASVPVWQTGIRYGYIVKRYTIAREGVFVPDGLNQGELLTKAPLRPVSNETFDSLSLSDTRAAVVQEAVYSTDFQQNNGSDDFMTFMKTYEELEVRLGFALFMCDMSPVIAKAAGLQFIDLNIIEGERYAYSISLANIPDGMQVETAVTMVDAGILTELPEVDDIQAIFLDRVVKFRWPVMFHKSVYSAYIIDKSIDGKTWSPVSELPLINFSEQENPDYFIYTDSLKRNDQQTWYRIKGISPFGETGPPSEIITGKGISEFSAYTSIDTAIVIENNRVMIRWRISESPASPIKGINILRSGSYNGTFEHLNRKLLNPGVRTFTDDNPGQSNYYQVMLTGNDNLTSFSFPYFVQTEDNEPPKPPEMLSGNVDSSGIATIIWKRNTEPDLLGYKTFRANSPFEEFISLEQGINPENLCIDTINLNTLTQKIYYQVIAVDKNYNSSAYSSILELSRPDTIPPAPAIITRIDVNGDNATILFERSPGNDINYYELHRQTEGDSISDRIITWNKELPATYKDSPSILGKNLYYSLITFDKAGNRSENGRKVFIPSASSEPFNLKAAQSADGQTITLQWEVPEGFIPAKTIIYRSINSKPIAIYDTMEGSEQIFSDMDVEINTIYNYGVLVYATDYRVVRSRQLRFNPKPANE